MSIFAGAKDKTQASVVFLKFVKQFNRHSRQPPCRSPLQPEASVLWRIRDRGRPLDRSLSSPEQRGRFSGGSGFPVESSTAIRGGNDGLGLL